MRYVGIWAAMVLMVGAAAWGQDDIKPEDLKKQLQETVNQLKAAQDRKSELAKENAELTIKVADLEKQHNDDTAQLAELKIEVASFAERTFFLRSHYNAWLQFIVENPLARLQWDLFLTTKVTVNEPSVHLPLLELQWPNEAN
jgi:chromosome segregation ATPase